MIIPYFKNSDRNSSSLLFFLIMPDSQKYEWHTRSESRVTKTLIKITKMGKLVWMNQYIMLIVFFI